MAGVLGGTQFGVVLGGPGDGTDAFSGDGGAVCGALRGVLLEVLVCKDRPGFWLFGVYAVCWCNCFHAPWSKD